MHRVCPASTVSDANDRLHALYDRVAPLYVLLHPVMRLIARRAASLLPLGAPLVVLDVATGTGILAQELAKGGHRVIGADLSFGMLSQAGAARRGLKIAGVQADARCLPFPDRSADVCSISMALHEFDHENRRHILGEMIRVSRRYLLVTDFDGPHMLPIRLVERFERSHYADFAAPGRLPAILSDAGLHVERYASRLSIGACLCRVPGFAGGRTAHLEERS